MVMGTHIARLVRMPNPSLFLVLVLFLSLVRYTCGAGGDTETESLLTFKDSLTISSSLNNWNASVPPCIGDIGNWVGVLCHDSKVIGLQLENMGLAGTVNIESLGALHELRSLSLMNNNFDGKLPDVKNLSMLKALYLSNNRFSGEISDEEFQGMLSLKRVFLANNAFTGKVPKSVTTLPKLTILKLEGNQFSGVIPEFYGKELKNKNLCGPPLKACGMSPPPSSPPSPSGPPHSPPVPTVKKSSTALTIALIVVSVVLLAIIALLVFCLVRRRGRSISSEEEAFVNESTKPPASDEGEKKVPETSTTIHVKRSELIFLNEDVQRFDLQDLLRASAEILGSGNFGASYKAIIGKGEAVVVKNYKQMNNVGREDFHEHMRRLGRLSHQNLLPVLAYYYRKEEKLLVSKFVVDGSLASHLHANRSEEKPGLDWQTRLKIIRGVVNTNTNICS
ncbi:hypothetical protein GOBAR_DD26124 [Gossypium barbadense]|nr:hypothetical protein GOBAR_DD26124 [Gossypium barbadense]